MAATSLAEFTVNGVTSQIKSNISAALANVRSDRADGAVTTEPPAEYFIYEKIIGYKTPAIVVVAGEIDFRLRDGQNSVNSMVKVYVSCVLEDRIADNLTLKTYRYSDALYSCLNRAHIVDVPKNRQSIVKVTRMDFSKMVDNKSNVTSPFRKEVMITLEVENYESES